MRKIFIRVRLHPDCEYRGLGFSIVPPLKRGVSYPIDIILNPDMHRTITNVCKQSSVNDRFLSDCQH